MASLSVPWVVATIIFELVQVSHSVEMDPIEYQDGDRVDLKVKKLTSARNQKLYGYYTFPFCKPPFIKKSTGNLWDFLTGDAIENSPYEIQMLRNDSCKLLCLRFVAEDQKQDARSMVEDEYVANFIIDDLRATTRYMRQADGLPISVKGGFPVGILKEGHYFIHNHIMLDLQYHKSSHAYHIVGFEVEPHSITHSIHRDALSPGGLATLCGHSFAPSKFFDIDAHNPIVYTYGVRWTESDKSRWDIHLSRRNVGIAAKYQWAAWAGVAVACFALAGLQVVARRKRRDRRSLALHVDCETQADMEAEAWAVDQSPVMVAPTGEDKDVLTEFHYMD